MWNCIWPFVLFFNLRHFQLSPPNLSRSHLFLQRLFCLTLLNCICIIFMITLSRTHTRQVPMLTVRCIFILCRCHVLLFDLLYSFTVNLVHTFLMLVLETFFKSGARVMSDVNPLLEFSSQFIQLLFFVKLFGFRLFHFKFFDCSKIFIKLLVSHSTRLWSLILLINFKLLIYIKSN